MADITNKDKKFATGLDTPDPPGLRPPDAAERLLRNAQPQPQRPPRQLETTTANAASTSSTATAADRETDEAATDSSVAAKTHQPTAGTDKAATATAAGKATTDD